MVRLEWTDKVDLRLAIETMGVDDLITILLICEWLVANSSACSSDRTRMVPLSLSMVALGSTITVLRSVASSGSGLAIFDSGLGIGVGIGSLRFESLLVLEGFSLLGIFDFSVNEEAMSGKSTWGMRNVALK